MATYTPNPFVERVQTGAQLGLIENVFLEPHHVGLCRK